MVCHLCNGIRYNDCLCNGSSGTDDQVVHPERFSPKKRRVKPSFFCAVNTGFCFVLHYEIYLISGAFVLKYEIYLIPGVFALNYGIYPISGVLVLKYEIYLMLVLSFLCKTENPIFLHFVYKLLLKLEIIYTL